MDTKEANTIKGTDKGFAVSAAMVIVSAVLWGLYGTFVTILTSMGLARNALVFLRMLGTSLPVGLLIFATDRRAGYSAFHLQRPLQPALFHLLLYGCDQGHQNSDRRRASLYSAGHRHGLIRHSLS